MPALTVGVGRTVILTDATAGVHGVIPVVVRVSVATPENEEFGVHTAFRVFSFGVNTPGVVVVQTPPVAEPPIEPESVAAVPWQIVWAGPEFTVGVGKTVIVTVEEAAVQGDIPVVVNVRTAVPEYAGGGVQVAPRFVLLGLNEPPAGVDHIPPVAEPPIIPFKLTEPPLQIV